jgi:hypothetical protein
MFDLLNRFDSDSLGLCSNRHPNWLPMSAPLILALMSAGLGLAALVQAPPVLLFAPVWFAFCVLCPRSTWISWLGFVAVLNHAVAIRSAVALGIVGLLGA